MRRSITAITLATVILVHSWYTNRSDPVTHQGCCGGSDCAQLVIGPGVMDVQADGYHIHLTLEQAHRINPQRIWPVDIVVPWDRVQDSEDGNYHLCIPIDNERVRGDFYCFFAPPNT